MKSENIWRRLAAEAARLGARKRSRRLEKTAQWVDQKIREGFVPIREHNQRYFVNRRAVVHSVLSKRNLRYNTTKWGYHTVMINRFRGDPHKRVAVHSLVAAAFIGKRPTNQEVDHINRIKTDNRVENLRYVFRSVNMHNRVRSDVGRKFDSKFKGVLRSGVYTWRVLVTKDKQTVYLETFTDERKAALAYDKMATRVFGKNAATNKSLGLL